MKKRNFTPAFKSSGDMLKERGVMMEDEEVLTEIRDYFETLAKERKAAFESDITSLDKKLAYERAALLYARTERLLSKNRNGG